MYGNRKKKPPAQKDASPAPDSRPRSTEPAPAEATKEEQAKSDWERSDDGEKNAAEAQAKDTWEASDDEQEAGSTTPQVKDSWDASSDEEGAGPKPQVVSNGKSTETRMYCSIICISSDAGAIFA